MKIKITRYEKLKNKIAQLESQQWKLVREKEQKATELEKYVNRHRSLKFDGLETKDTDKLEKIYRYFDKQYPIDFQGGLRCDERGMRLCFWVDDDPDYLILHLSSTSKNICFSGSTSWQVKAETLADKVKTLKQIKNDIKKILK